VGKCTTSSFGLEVRTLETWYQVSQLYDHTMNLDCFENQKSHVVVYDRQSCHSVTKR